MASVDQIDKELANTQVTTVDVPPVASLSLPHPMPILDRPPRIPTAIAAWDTVSAPTRFSRCSFNVEVHQQGLQHRTLSDYLLHWAPDLCCGHKAHEMEYSTCVQYGSPAVQRTERKHRKPEAKRDTG
ncbi:hypothetical protein Q8A73_016569 [Channa argus]|nr:hypothetical protein Q8A73_016569 [Channa argus]